MKLKQLAALTTMLIVIGPTKVQLAQELRIPSIGMEKNYDAKSSSDLQEFLLGGWYLPDGHYIILKEAGKATVGELYKGLPQAAAWRADTTTSFVYTLRATGTTISVPIAFVSKTQMILYGTNGTPDLVKLKYVRDDGSPFVKLRGAWRLNGDSADHYYVYSFSVPDFMQVGEYRGGQFINGSSSETAYGLDRLTITNYKQSGRSEDFRVRILNKTLVLSPATGQANLQLVRCVPNPKDNGCSQ